MKNDKDDCKGSFGDSLDSVGRATEAVYLRKEKVPQADY